MSQCARPFCFQVGKSRCSSCLKDSYCGSDCQKKDWKSHKAICNTLKTLSNELRPYHEVGPIIMALLKEPENVGKDIRVFEHVISYAKFQFGDRDPGKSYRERGNINRIDNWELEINILYHIYLRLYNTCINNNSLSSIIKNNMMLPYLKKRNELLKPWSVLIGLDNPRCTGTLNDYQTNQILDRCSSTERSMADIYMERHEFTVAENHSQRALTFAKRYEGHKKTNLLFRAFSTCCAVRKMQEDYINALTYAEEAYNCVAIAFNPVHPMVQDAAGTLIECLTHKGDFYDALRFAEMTFSNLCDPANGLDQNSEAVAAGYYCLGNVISMQDGDHVKAERLARESYRIRVQIYGDDHYLVGSSIGLIANTLKGQDKLGDETKKLYERSLAIYTRNEGPDGVNTAFGNAVLGNYYVALSESQLTVETKKEHFMLAFGSYHEAVRITKKIYGTDHPKYIDNLDKLCIITHHIELLG